MASSPAMWKERCKWIAGCALGVVVVAVTIALVAKDEKVPTYFAAIATGSSIVLAVVAIVYSSLERIAFRQQVGEMEALVRQASSLLREKAGDFADKTVLLEKMTQSFMSVRSREEREPEEEEATAGPAQPTYPLKVSALAGFPLLVLYLLAKSRKAIRGVPFLHAVKLCTRDRPEISEGSIGSFFGALGCLIAVEGVSVIIARESGEVFAKDIASTIEEDVLEEMRRRLKDEGVTLHEKETIKMAQREIDEYFRAV